MQDIYDVKSVIDIAAINYRSLIILIIVLILIIILFWIYKKYFYKETKANIEEIKQEEIFDKKFFLKRLTKLSKKANKYSDKDFVDKLNNILRGYMETIGIQLAQKMTIQEIRNQIRDQDLLEFIEKIYFVQFEQNNKDIALDKKDLVSQTKKFIINI